MIHVVCALVVDNGRLLIVQHGPSSHYPGKWEFPGGKVHPGESPEAALIREIREELEMGIQIIIPLEPNYYVYTDKTILLKPFLCSGNSNKLILHEHVRCEWVGLKDIPGFDLLPADKAVLDSEKNCEELIKFMNKIVL